MPLPPNLRKKERLWNEAQRQRQDNLDRVARGQPPVPMPDPVPPIVTQPSAEPPAQELPPAEESPAQVMGGGMVDGSAEAPILEVAPQPPAAAPEVIDRAEYERVKSRASTSEGLLRVANERAETQKARAEAAERESQELKQQLEQERRRQPPKPLTREELLAHGFTEAQLDEQGEEACRIQVQISEATASKQVATLRQELEAEKQRVNAERVKERTAAFWALLNVLFPKWKEVNASDGWLKWLGQTDPVSGHQRQELLNEAKAALNAERVAGIFNAYTQSQAAQPPKEPPANRQLPPSRPAADRPLEPPPQEIVTRQQLAEHAARWGRDSRYRSSAEGKAMQEKIDKATRERRVR